MKVFSLPDARFFLRCFRNLPSRIFHEKTECAKQQTWRHYDVERPAPVVEGRIDLSAQHIAKRTPHRNRQVKERHHAPAHLLREDIGEDRGSGGPVGRLPHPDKKPRDEQNRKCRRQSRPCTRQAPDHDAKTDDMPARNAVREKSEKRREHHIAQQERGAKPAKFRPGIEIAGKEKRLVDFRQYRSQHLAVDVIEKIDAKEQREGAFCALLECRCGSRQGAQIVLCCALLPLKTFSFRGFLIESGGMLLSLGKFIAGLIYRVTTRGIETLPKSGFLLLPNHVTWVDAIVLQIACPRMIRFMVFDEIYNTPALHWFFRLIKAIPISPKHSKEAMRKAIDLIKEGEIVCIFPEGELSRSGILLRLKRGYELIARGAEAPVVPVWLDQLWGSIFSFYGGKYFKKIPRKIPYPLMVAFGEALTAEQANIATVRQKLLELGEMCYEERPILQSNLAEACVRGLKHKQFDVALIDGMDHSTLTHGMVLAAGIAVSKYIRKTCKG